MALFVDDVAPVATSSGIEEGVILGEYSSFSNLGGVTLRYRF